MANAQINIPFIPQEGITSQILSAIQAANEEHHQRQQMAFAQQQLAQTGAYQQSQIANEQANTEIRKRAADLEEKKLPGDLALTHAMAEYHQKQADQMDLERQRSQAMIDALGGPTGAAQPQPGSQAAPQAPMTNTTGVTPQPGPPQQAPEPGSAVEWATQHIPGHLLGTVLPVLGELKGPLTSEEKGKLARAMTDAPKAMLDLGKQTGTTSGYATPFGDAVDKINAARNTPEGLAKRAAAGDPDALAVINQQSKQAGQKAAAEAGATLPAKVALERAKLAAEMPYKLALQKSELEQSKQDLPAFAINPKTGQRELTTFGEAKQSGLTAPIKVTQAQVESEATLNSQLNDLQLNTSRYKAALNRMGPLSSMDAKYMAQILANPDVHSGIMSNVGMPALVSMIEQGATAKGWNELSPDKQDALMGALRMKNSAILFQKVTSGTGRVNEEAMKIELQNMPSPIEGATVGNKKLGAFQENIDQIAGRSVKLPFMSTPQEVKSKLEKEAVDRYNEDNKSGAGAFKGNVYVVGKGTAAPQVGDTIIVHNTQMKVTKMYPNGTYDAK